MLLEKPLLEIASEMMMANVLEIEVEDGSSTVAFEPNHEPDLYGVAQFFDCHAPKVSWVNSRHGFTRGGHMGAFRRLPKGWSSGGALVCKDQVEIAGLPTTVEMLVRSTLFAAVAAAKEAAESFENDFGITGDGYCGYSWMNTSDVETPIARYLRATGRAGEPDIYGMRISLPRRHKHSSSFDYNVAAMRAAAKAFEDWLGIKTTVGAAPM
jgi:hypothetical protein